jgi:hypothetical protein
MYTTELVKVVVVRLMLAKRVNAHQEHSYEWLLPPAEALI